MLAEKHSHALTMAHPVARVTGKPYGEAVREACIEACDRSMQRFGFPHGLLRYASPNAIDRRPRRWLRAPR